MVAAKPASRSPRLLVLGGSGMLGHRIWLHLQARYDTWVTLRRPKEAFREFGLFAEAKVIEGLAASDFASLEECISSVRPNVVINCIGIVKQIKEAADPIPSITINSLLPHQVARICERMGARLIHFSTDCVFSGRRGRYKEDDTADAVDLYGRTKYLGEIRDRPSAITLRTSIVGKEIDSAHGLIEWFLRQEGKRVRGFKKAIFTGLTTNEMARVVEMLIEQQPAASGLWHVASEPISKFDLLTLVKQRLKLAVEMEEDCEFDCDRSLDGERFNKTFGYRPPGWPNMIDEMALEMEKYRTRKR